MVRTYKLGLSQTRTVQIGTVLVGVALAATPSHAQGTAQLNAQVELLQRQLQALQQQLNEVKRTAQQSADEARRSQEQATRAAAAAQRSTEINTAYRSPPGQGAGGEPPLRQLQGGQPQGGPDQGGQGQGAPNPTQRQLGQSAVQPGGQLIGRSDDPNAIRIGIVKGKPTVGTADGNYSLSIGGYLQFDSAAYFQGSRAAPDRRSVPDLNDGVNLRRARLPITAVLDRDFIFRLTPDFGGSPDGNTTSQLLYEATASYTGLKPLTLTVGYYKPEYTLQDSMASNEFLFLERPSSTEIARSSFAAGDARASVGGHANGDRWFVASYLTGAQYGAQTSSLLNDEQVGGVLRVAGRPLAMENANIHVGISASDVFHPNQLASGTAGASRTTLQLRDRPELRIDQNRLIDTGAISATGGGNGGLELAGNYRNFLIQGEYYRYWVDQAKLPGSYSPELAFDGGYVELAYTLTGEPRPYQAASAAYGQPRVAHPFTFEHGGYGAFELAARYSYMNLDDHVTRGRPAALTGGVFGGKQQVYTLGLNWYPNDNIRFMLDYYFTDVNRLDASGINQIGQRFQAVALRTQAFF